MGLSDGVTGWVMQQFRAGVDPRRLLETVLLPGATLVCVCVCVCVCVRVHMFIYLCHSEYMYIQYVYRVCTYVCVYLVNFIGTSS